MIDYEKVKEFINKLPLTSDYKRDIYVFIEEFISGKKTDVSYFRKIADRLYETEYSSIDYDFAKKYYDANGTIIPIGGCSSISVGKYLARNFDLIYDNRATIVVKTTGDNDKYQTLGVCSYDQFTKLFIESKTEHDIYKLLPFIINDGINSAGLTVSVNVVPLYYNNGDILPTGEVKDTIYASMVVRYLLDHCASVEEAVTLLKENILIKPSLWATKQGFDVQFIIADSTTSKIINFKDNVVVDTDANYITNFAMCEVDVNDDGSVYTPATLDETHKPSVDNNIQPNGQGLERFNIINEAYSNIEDIDDVIDLLEDLVYTKSYTILEPEPEPETEPDDTDESDDTEDSDDVEDNEDNEDNEDIEDSEDTEQTPNLVWYTEFTGINGNDIDSTPEDFEDTLIVAREKFANRSKDKSNPNYGTWETIHSSVYNRDTKSLSIFLHEDFDVKYDFTL